MEIDDVLRLRQHSQFLLRKKAPTPEAVVHAFGALQAQDYHGAKWAIAQRTRGTSSAGLDEALAAGKLIRIHVMRPTWHFVLPEDVRWMLELTAPRIIAASRYYWQNAGLNDAVLKRSVRILRGALAGGRQLTRAEIAAVLQRGGIPTSAGRLPHVLLHAEMQLAICSGALRGKQHTYALLDERVPATAPMTREAALASLAARFFACHGPATLMDFAWWSGLSSADAARGLEAVRATLREETVPGQAYWCIKSGRPTRGPSVSLLPNYDEYIVGYAEHGRPPLLNQMHIRDLDNRRNPLFNHTIVMDGRIIGTWRPHRNKAAGSIQTELFVRLTSPQERLLAEAVGAYFRFLGPTPTSGRGTPADRT